MGFFKNRFVRSWLQILLSAILFTTGHLQCANAAGVKEYIVAKSSYSESMVEGSSRFDKKEDAANAAMVALCKSSSQYSLCRNAKVNFEYYQLTNKWTWQGSFEYGANPPLPQTIWGHIFYECPAGWNLPTLDKDAGFCWRDEEETLCDSCDGRVAPVAGNPIVLSGQVKRQSETDYSNVSGTLTFTRTYRSDTRGWAHNYQAFAVDFTQPNRDAMPDNACVKVTGQGTEKVACPRLAGRRLANDFGVRRGNGRLKYFGSNSDLFPAKDINDRVTPVLDAAGKKTGWTVTNAQAQTVETYDLTGRLQKTKALNGQTLSFAYSDASTPIAIAAKPGLLTRVTDHFGSKLNFTYDAKGRMITMQDPAGQHYLYGYDDFDNLTTVTYPDGKSKTYVYNEPDLTAGTDLPFALTGIIDENNVRFASFGYDASGKAVSTEHAGGVNRHVITSTDPSLIVDTDASGAERTYMFSSYLGARRASGMSQQAPGWPYQPTASTMVSYDANGNVSMTSNLDSIMTTYEYDLARNLETKRTEGAWTPQSRTITTNWHTNYRLPTKIAEPLRLTTFEYYANGTLWKRTIQETQDANGSQGLNAQPVGVARTVTYTYNAAGQIETIKGPRTDLVEMTTYTYLADGNLSTIKNALGHVTKYERYDAHGRAGSITASDGTVTELTYKPRGWLESSKVTANGLSELTTYEYDDVGQLKRVTLPDNSFVRYDYDDAHRLYRISDTVGNSIEYTLDLMGNKAEEKATSGAGILARKVSRIFDVLGRVTSQTGAQP